jgi:hypothetical protein
MRTLLLSLAFVLTLSALASACPACKDTIANSDAAGTPTVAGAFNSSIYVMLGAFLGVLGMVAGVIIKGIRGS